jgi:hypothetical protein
MLPVRQQRHCKLNMHLHIVYRGQPADITPLIYWCHSVGATYYLTHIALVIESIDGADEVITPQRFWSESGEALVHVWEQPAVADSFRIFKKITYAMNCASISRLNRDLLLRVPTDGVVYYDSTQGSVPTSIPEFEKLHQDEILAVVNNKMGEVDHSFFITRPHNFDRISLLWKRNNIPTPYNTPAIITSKTVWWKWLRLLGMEVTPL